MRGQAASVACFGSTSATTRSCSAGIGTNYTSAACRLAACAPRATRVQTFFSERRRIDVDRPAHARAAECRERFAQAWQECLQRRATHALHEHLPALESDATRERRRNRREHLD